MVGHGQRVTVAAVAEPELALEVGTPETIGRSQGRSAVDLAAFQGRVEGLSVQEIRVNKAGEDHAPEKRELETTDFRDGLEIRRRQPGWIDVDFFPPNGIERSNGFLQSINQPAG